MGYIQEQRDMGVRIYGLKSWREKRRIFLFLMRSLKNKKQVDGFHHFLLITSIFHTFWIFIMP